MGTAVLLALVLLIAGLVAVFRLRRPAARAPQPLAELAAAYRGEIRRIDGVDLLFVRRPRLHVAVERSRFSARPETAFRGCLQVAPEGAGDRLRRFFGGVDLRLGDSVARGHPDAFVDEVLSDEVRTLLRGLALWGPVTLTVSPGMLQLRVDTGEDILDRLISSGLQIAELVPQTVPGEKIIIVESKRGVAGTACQVCGTPLEGEIVECGKCSTLHHADCWEFNGRCSTFACGSLGSRKAVVR